MFKTLKRLKDVDAENGTIKWGIHKMLRTTDRADYETAWKKVIASHETSETAAKMKMKLFLPKLSRRHKLPTQFKHPISTRETLCVSGPMYDDTLEFIQRHIIAIDNSAICGFRCVFGYSEVPHIYCSRTHQCTVCGESDIDKIDKAADRGKGVTISSVYQCMQTIDPDLCSQYDSITSAHAIIESILEKHLGDSVDSLVYGICWMHAKVAKSARA